jgi:hypothetical protein
MELRQGCKWRSQRVACERHPHVTKLPHVWVPFTSLWKPPVTVISGATHVSFYPLDDTKKRIGWYELLEGRKCRDKHFVDDMHNPIICIYVCQKHLSTIDLDAFSHRGRHCI